MHVHYTYSLHSVLFQYFQYFNNFKICAQTSICQSFLIFCNIVKFRNIFITFNMFPRFQSSSIFSLFSKILNIFEYFSKSSICHMFHICDIFQSSKFQIIFSIFFIFLHFHVFAHCWAEPHLLMVTKEISTTSSLRIMVQIVNKYHVLVHSMTSS